MMIAEVHAMEKNEQFESDIEQLGRLAGRIDDVVDGAERRPPADRLKHATRVHALIVQAG
jgi:hypothetical protein